MDPEKHLLIDGSNLMHAWPETRALLKRDRAAARSRLAQAAAAIHDTEHIRVSLVFDGRGPDVVIEQPSGQASFVILYSPSGLTADDVIEQMVGKARAPAECLVATDDRAERQTVEALGASCLSAADLATWAEQVSQRQQTRLTERRRANDQEWRRPR